MKNKTEEENNNYKTILGAYYGVMFMDEYPLQDYILKNIENLRLNYLQNKNIPADLIKSEVVNKVSKKTKLQDALYILNELD